MFGAVFHKVYGCYPSNKDMYYQVSSIYPSKCKDWAFQKYPAAKLAIHQSILHCVLWLAVQSVQLLNQLINYQNDWCANVTRECVCDYCNWTWLSWVSFWTYQYRKSIQIVKIKNVEINSVLVCPYTRFLSVFDFGGFWRFWFGFYSIPKF